MGTAAEEKERKKERKNMSFLDLTRVEPTVTGKHQKQR